LPGEAKIYRHMGKARIRALVLLTSILVSCACAYSLDPSLDVSQYAHTAWKIREGFATGTIHEITQTPDGYLWLATESGLLRFDGDRIVPWQPPSGERLPSNDIRALVAGQDGTLWLGTAKGLVSWKDDRLTQFPQLAGFDVYTLLQDHEGTVWAAGVMWEAGLSQPGKLCAIKGGNVRCNGSDGTFSFGVTAAYEDSRGNLWLGAGNGLWRWQPGPPDHYELPAAKQSSLPALVFNRNALVEGEHGNLLVAGPGGLRQLIDGEIKGYSLPSGAPQFNEPGTLLRDRSGGLWIGTLDRGILHVHQGRTDVYSQSDGLTGNAVESFFEDREGNVWVSTTAGLDRFRAYAIPTISVKQGLSSPFAVCVLAAKDGSVWLGTTDGLNRWKDGQVTIYRKRTAATRNSNAVIAEGLAVKHANAIQYISLPGNYIDSLYQDTQGRIWVATHQGVGYFENGRFMRFNAMQITYAIPITGDSSGNIWAASTEQGLCRLRIGKPVQCIPWAKLGSRGSFSDSLVVDPIRGGFWLGFWKGGVVYFKHGEVRASFGTADGLGAGRVNALKRDSDNTLWAATDGGLSRIKDGHVATLTSKNGLPCDTIHDLIDDDSQSFWLYTACGLVRVARSELDAWAGDPQRKIRVTVFDSSDGIRSHAGVYYPAPRVAKTVDGKLWFLPLDGVSVVDPNRLPFNTLPPPVHVEQITADRKQYASRSGLRLPPLVRDLEIDYTALSFVAPEKVHFRYKLEGRDADWQDVGNRRQAFYTNLPPRAYRFRVVACNNSGVWNEEGASLDFSIAPAYYQTNWFRALCAAAFLALLWALYRLRVRRLRDLYANLQKSEDRLRLVINTIPAMVWSARPDGRLDLVNQRWVEYTGLSPEEGLDWKWREAVHPDDIERFVREWRASLASGEPMRTEIRVRAADGEYRWWLVRNVPLRDENGDIVKWYGSSTDIQDRKQAEQLQADLAHMNRVTTLGELAASISHELKQPIAAAMTNANTGLRWLRRGQPDVKEAGDAMERIVKDNARAAEIIDRLRSLYKNAPPKRESLDVSEIILGMVALLRGEANRFATSIRTDLATDLPNITGDRVQLQQVFMNIMLNGIEAMKDTGGVLTVKSQVSQGGEVLISICDTGIGLPAENVDQIFSAFFTTKPQGSGMGLAISRSIVEAHGGHLWATAKDGRGAAFHFTLPIAAEVKVPAAGL